MRTQIHRELVQQPLVAEANDILRKCVHCGFCTATCPTYQLLGDELDGPRGRIYLIKNLLETNDIDADSRVHLDRCLTCRSCETTCPSGVEYGRLLDIGRNIASEKIKPGLKQRVLTRLLRMVVPRGAVMKILVRMGQFCRPMVPGTLRQHIPRRKPVRSSQDTCGARVLLLGGCVQSAATPDVVASLQVLLEAVGIKSEEVDPGCCGALDYHLGAHDAGLDRMRSIIDTIHPRLNEIDFVVSSATGCGVTLKEYPLVLKEDPFYFQKAVEVADRVVDAVEMFDELPIRTQARIAMQTPCSMQHGMKLGGRVERLLEKAGATIVDQEGSHLCCGSAGTYSILQPDLADQLRQNKIRYLEAGRPDVILTANIGCQMHLEPSASTPVMHWLEYAADQLPG